jgi:hypothetical protein
MAVAQIGEPGPRDRTRPQADPGQRRRRRSSVIKSRVIAPFDCLNCEAPLAIVMADPNNDTYLMLGPMAKLREGTIECDCGAVREFTSLNAPPGVPPPHRSNVDSLPKST